MSGFTKAMREFDRKSGVKPSTSLDRESYESWHGAAKDKLIKSLGSNAHPGKGIDVEVTSNGKTIPIEVTVLPSWNGKEFPFEELKIRKDRLKRPYQSFAYFNANLDVMTVAGQYMFSERGDYYIVPKKQLKLVRIS